MSKVIQFTGISRLDLSPDVILENSIGRFEGVVIIGYDKNGEEFFASSYADGGTIMWLLERCKTKLMEAAQA